MQGIYHRFYNQIYKILDDYLVLGLRSIHLQKAFLTGKLAFPQTYSFSGINHITCYSIFNNAYASYFGFCHEEIIQLFNHSNIHELENLKTKYGGFRIGNHELFHTQSILESFDLELDKSNSTMIFSDPLIDRLNSASDSIKQTIYELSCGHSVNCTINMHISYDKLNIIFNSQEMNEINIWGILLHMGYLSATSWKCKSNEIQAELKIPNSSLLAGFKQLIAKWEIGINQDRPVFQI